MSGYADKVRILSGKSKDKMLVRCTINIGPCTNALIAEFSKCHRASNCSAKFSTKVIRQGRTRQASDWERKAASARGEEGVCTRRVGTVVGRRSVMPSVGHHTLSKKRRVLE